jgi:hypothetical protein
MTSHNRSSHNGRPTKVDAVKLFKLLVAEAVRAGCVP